MKYENKKIKNNINKNKIEIKNKKIQIYNFKNLEKQKLNSKNKIYIQKIKKEINLFIKKINNNFYFLSNLNKLLKNHNKKFQTTLNIFFQIIKEKYDFIVFDLSKYNFGLFNKEILKKGGENFILTEATLLGIKEVRRLINLYVYKWKINKDSLHIVENKYKYSYISKDLVSKILLTKEEIFAINESKKYNFFIDNFLKRDILLKNKKIKKNLKKIIEIILN